MKHRKTAKKKENKFLGLSASSWTVIIILGVLAILPDFPVDVAAAIADLVFLIWALTKK